MAGVGSLKEQVGVVAELRWRLFRNSLRSGTGLAEFIARIMLASLAAIGVLGIGLTFGLFTVIAFKSGRMDLLGVVTWGIFGCWLFVPILLAGMGIDFDFRNLLRYPLRFSTFVTMSLLYGMLDAPSVAAVFWTACVATGLALARPDLLPFGFLILLIFTVASFLLNRVFLNWIDRMMARRRTRETFLAVFVFTLLAVQLSGALIGRWGSEAAPWAHKAKPLLVILPPGTANEALRATAAGEWPVTALGMTLLAAYAVGGGFLLRRRLRAQYFGELIGEGTSAQPREKVATGISLPGISETTAAVCEKELRYAIRNGQTWMTLVMPLIMVVFFSLAWNRPKAQPDFLSRSPEMFLPGILAYGMLILTPLLHNTFAFEGKGFQLLLVTPVRFQEVFLAKNLMHGVMVVLIAALTLLLSSFLVAPPGIGLVAMTLTGLLFVTLVQLMIGNAVSVYFARQIEFGQFRKRASQMNALAGLLSQVIVIGAVALVGLICRLVAPATWMWLSATAFLVMSLLAGLVYRESLGWCARLVMERREKLLTDLAGR